MKYLLTDCETGGLSPDTSLLSLYIGILDESFNILQELDLLVKPDDGLYKVSASGLKVNKIDIVQHDTDAISYDKASGLIRKLIKKWGAEERLVPLGHNVKFDIKRITDNCVNMGTWEQYVGYRTLDTGTIGMALIDAGLIDAVDAGLDKLATYFEIPIKDAYHTAKYDAFLTLEVYKKMKGILTSVRN